MEPELRPGQFAYVQDFDARGGANYLDQRMAFRHEERVLVRRSQVLPGGRIRLFGNRKGSEQEIIPPDDWEQPSDWKLFGRWKLSGRLHPRLVALGPLVTARAGGRTYIATAGWAN